ncbi:type II toxin-antitoxin system RelE/ParE family toxin [Solidesulfovibrio sp.]|uniref:type II toxin-antitoxin system RelE/ParE family toxin n=1 Tax=Solidesulfovibrio sp. TaxID=2910990 RepID=UPI0026102628|nr:type II toxin-antitoxin system RelE/ParE family toxin [Solidesulfovibrio sp.]
MDVLFLEPAVREFEDAVSYYNAECSGLGFTFATAVEKTLSRIVAHPDAWHSLSPRTRRCRVPGFPYGIIYQQGSDSVVVVAVMHMRRHPAHWRDRIARRP